MMFQVRTFLQTDIEEKAERGGGEAMSGKLWKDTGEGQGRRVD